MNLSTVFIVVVALLALIGAGLVWWGFTRIVSAAFEEQFLLLEAHALDVQSDPSPQQQERGAPVFVSYSRRDQELVRRLLGLFKAADLPVFRDEDGILPGRKWRIAINEALEHCQTVLVFWCGHAAQSSEVKYEYERAISLDKRVVPVMMDETELPTILGQYQGVDLRMALGKSHEYLMAVIDEQASYRTVAACRGPGWEKAMKAKRRQFSEANRIVVRASRHLESSLDSIL